MTNSSTPVPDGGTSNRFIITFLVLLAAAFIIPLILPAVGKGRVRRPEQVNRLKNISLAQLNYYTQNQAIAYDLADESGNALHSWETQLLPLIDQAALYRKIDHHQLWNLDVNRDAMKMILTVYQTPDFQREFAVEKKTGFALSHFSANSRILRDGSVRTGDAFEKRCSNTILLGEVQEGFMPWGEPGNVRDPAVGLNVAGGFGHPRKTGVYFAFGDGHVEAIDAKIDPKVFEVMSTPGEQEF